MSLRSPPGVGVAVVDGRGIAWLLRFFPVPNAMFSLVYLMPCSRLVDSLGRHDVLAHSLSDGPNAGPHSVCFVSWILYVIRCPPYGVWVA